MVPGLNWSGNRTQVQQSTNDNFKLPKQLIIMILSKNISSHLVLAKIGLSKCNARLIVLKNLAVNLGLRHVQVKHGGKLTQK
eukprot:4437678-Ditylum_brightwellii.AAC.1